MPERETMALSFNGDAVDRSGHARSRQGLPTIEGSQAASGFARCTESSSNQKLKQRPCSPNHRCLTSISATTASQCSTRGGTLPKTDVSDAQWLQRLHSFGLLRASFRPKGQIAELRAYVRQRERLLEYAASHIQHMQKALTEMNLQLHHVVADITGATGLRIIRAILAGERDPEALACLRDSRCQASAETIAKALTGNYRSEHLFALEQALALYYAYHEKVSACDD